MSIPPELGQPERVQPTEITAGHHWVERTTDDGLTTGWYPVIEVAWVEERRRFEVWFDRPQELADRLHDHYLLTPATSELVRSTQSAPIDSATDSATGAVDTPHPPRHTPQPHVQEERRP